MPADLGFYDLRLEEARLAQEALAKAYGIYGFCYYHYWFNGKRILETPLERKLANPKEDLPFMLCWANENWTKIWDGGESNILREQKYSAQDDLAHMQSLIPFFKDSRYIRVNNKPVFAIYRSTKLPNIKATLKRWRTEAQKAGIELYLCRVESFAEAGENYLADGFDASIRFEPFSASLGTYIQFEKNKLLKNKWSKWYLRYKFLSSSKKQILLQKLSQKIDYSKYVDYLTSHPSASYKCFPCVTPMWDNTARRKQNQVIFINSTPDKFCQWLQFEVNEFKPFSNEENFIFINAWNEWAEGNHLEPCQKWGMSYLEVVKKVVNA